MSNLLITGGCGYIGSHTIIALLEEGYTIHIIDNLSNSSPIVLDRIRTIVNEKAFSRVVFHQCDMMDKYAVQKVFDSVIIDAVVHFAGLKSVGESVQNPLLYYNTNLITTLEVRARLSDYWQGRSLCGTSSEL